MATMREGVSALRLCVSESFAEDTPWKTSLASNRHMMIDKVPVCSHKDMRHIPHSNPSEQKESLGPLERLSQIGPKAWKHIFHQLTCGRAAPDSPSRRKVVVVDPCPNFGGTLDAVWQLNQAWQKGADVPLFVGMAFYTPAANDTEKSKCQGMASYVKGMLMRTYWESSAEAGEPEPKRTEATTAARPNLSCFSWDASTGKPMIPDMVKQRFKDAEEDVQKAWGTFCLQSEDTILAQLEYDAFENTASALRGSVSVVRYVSCLSRASVDYCWESR